MTINIYSVNVPPPRVPLTDPSTGQIATVWWNVLIGLTNRTGGIGTTGATGAPGAPGGNVSLVTLAQAISDAVGAGAATVDIPALPPSDVPDSVFAHSTQSDAPDLAPVYRPYPEDAPAPVPTPFMLEAGADTSSWAVVAKASLPTPSASTVGWLRYVSDATGAVDIVPAYCTSTQWRRFSDDSVVS